MHGFWRAYVRVGAAKERALRRIMPSRMQFVHYSWPLRPDVCPCDIHFCEYLRERNVRRKSIFHFGTGGHHIVGLQNQEFGLENHVLGLTASPNELWSYVTRVIRNPLFGKYYQVMFADIYTLSASCLPSFDIATLFHLSEFTDAAVDGQRMSDDDTLRLFCTKVVAGGHIFLYRGSYGYPRCVPLIDQAIADGHMAFVERYKSLDVFLVPGVPASTRGMAFE
jgi:hypothetical protein